MSDQIQIGDVVADCPECNTVNTVIYRGENTATCSSCATSFDCEVEQEKKPVEAPVQNVYVPHVADTVIISEKVEPVEEVPTIEEKIVESAIREEKERQEEVVESVGKLTREVGDLIHVDSSRFKLSEAMVGKKPDDVPDYILKSRPWRWAYEIKGTGNPYREGTRNHTTFNCFQGSGMTVAEAVVRLEPSFGDKISYLLTIYEVVTQCVFAGLLLMDSSTRKITVCKEPPKPGRIS